MTSTVVLAVDGSEHAQRATKWCADYARGRGAEVIAVHAVDIVYDLAAGSGLPFVPPMMTPPQLTELRDVIERDWCKPLADAGVPFRVVIDNARPAALVTETARSEHAELIVCGRRGRSGFVEAVLGSTSRELTHHAEIPLVIVP